MKSTEHQKTARAMAKAMEGKATEIELRRLYEEIMYEQFIAMDGNELSQIIRHG
tara:strand:+ start:42 stop:203 length:162 start_codon:yes stop_codon:yes gene_type:complete